MRTPAISSDGVTGKADRNSISRGGSSKIYGAMTHHSIEPSKVLPGASADHADDIGVYESRMWRETSFHVSALFS